MLLHILLYDEVFLYFILCVQSRLKFELDLNSKEFVISKTV
jgi:hypothetical protein